MLQLRIIIIVVFFFVFSSCEKKIDFNLKSSPVVLSVDASIETDSFPVVVLTQSLNYFSKVDIRVISESMIRDATVAISSGGKRIELIKRETFFPGNLSFVYYTCDALDPSLQMRGEQGKRYDLEISWKDQLYKASTIIPVLRKTIDSLWWEKAPFTDDTSTKVIVKGRFNDPQPFGDYIRYFTRVNSEPFYPGENSAFDDLLVNGTIYDIQIPRSIDRNRINETGRDLSFRRGDHITVKLSNIDRATFDFWRTTEFSYQSAGNPFFTPVKIIGNISNGALGYFGGYANQFRSIIIPPL